MLNRLEREEGAGGSALILYTKANKRKFSAPALLSLRQLSYAAAAEKDARRGTALREQLLYHDRSFV